MSRERSVSDIGPGRRALPALLASGMLFSLLGSILPVWGHHLRFDYQIIGHHFLALNGGMVVAALLSSRLLNRLGVRGLLLAGCLGAVAGILYLSLVPPPFADLWRMAGFVVIGAAGALLNAAVLHATSPAFQQSAGLTLNLAGGFFGVGSVLATVLIAETFHSLGTATILWLLAVVPALLAIRFARTTFPHASAPEPSVRDLLPQLTNPGAVLFSLLLFFQFGNEWAIAGWLPMFLIQRLGVSPASALQVVALYWTALLAGRIAAQWVMPRVSHWKLLLASGAGALFGCLLLFATNNLFGATLGALAVGLSFATIYPLVAEKIGARFPAYHPGVFNGLFSFALVGGTLAPAHLGYLAEWLGIGVVMVIPVLGTFMVLLLLALIWIESRFGSTQRQNDQRVA